jgi:ribosomal protein S18 acetylase RimI-like enzyme
MITIRKAHPGDLDFLVATDLLGDGYTIDPDEPPMTPAERAEHREKISAFVGGTADCGWIAEDDVDGVQVGMILVRFRDLVNEPETEANRFLLRFLDRSIFPEDGRFCEVFQLWVAPAYRRQGIATRLKTQIEEESRQREIWMVYTHTEARNAHVIELNRKLGYQIVRCGPLWDDVPRTSLVKWLE